MRKEAEQELIQSGTVSSDDIHAAKLNSRNNQLSILLNLLEGRSAESSESITEILAQHYKIPLLSLNKITPPQRMMKLCDSELARKLHFLPIAEHGDQVVIGMVDPLDLDYNDEVRAVFQRSIQPVFISMGDFERNYYRFYRKGISLPDENPALMNTIALKKAFLSTNQSDLSTDQKDIIAKKFATTIISRALSNGASSFSVEPQQDVSLVNLSLGGTEYNLFRFSISNHKAMVEAMMKLAKIDPSTHEGVDQFSRCQVKYMDQQYILAYSFRQTPTGERVVVHIIDSRMKNLTLEELGLPDQTVNQLKETLESPGMMLVTGPTGSGKSTMLQVITRYAKTLNKTIFTVEDIVGLKIDGVRQFQVKPQGPSKAKILKALQAKKADIVIIDEIDRETLPAVLDAVEAGCLILLSITAPNSGEAISKLLRSGISRSRLASALKLVSTHKVIRKLCSSCKGAATIHSTTLSQWNIPEHLKFQTGRGCDACKNSGYKETINLTEQLAVSQSLQELIKQGASGPELFEAARHEGMLTLIEQGFSKAIDGTTSLEEVLAAIPYNETFPVKNRMRMGRIMPLKSAVEAEAPATKPLFEKEEASSGTSPEAPHGTPDEESIFPDTETVGSITFSGISMPAEKKPEIIKEDEEPVEHLQTATTTVPEESRDQSKSNILLVDDSPVTLEFTRHILNVSGHFNVDATDTAKKALNMLQEKQYHLVITDQEMPEQTGQEFIDSIRQHPSLNSVGTILLTGNLNEMSALEGGADGYIAKPTDPELLVARAKSISDIYKRLSGVAPEKPAASISMQIPDSSSVTPGKVEFTEKDMENISGLELDTPVSTTPNPTAPETAPEEDTSANFDNLFK
ncbi:MAG: ATPase, T2SS/T4P/T4SS family [Mariprofundaceae bacterium]